MDTPIDPGTALSLVCQEHEQKIALLAALRAANERIAELEGDADPVTGQCEEPA